MRLVRVILLLAAITILHPLSAQLWVEEEAIYNEAEEYLDGQEYVEALPLYTLLEKKGYINAHISYKIGKCYLNIPGKKSRAIPYLESAVENAKDSATNAFSEKNAPLDAYMLLGQAYRINYQFDKAIETFNAYTELVASSDIESLIDYQIRMCKTAKVLGENPSGATLYEVDIKSRYPLYNPVLLNGGELGFMEERPFYDALVAGSLSNRVVDGTDNKTPEIKSDGDHILVSSINDGNVLVMTMYEAGAGFEIYSVVKKANGNWEEITKLPEPINSAFNETFAFLTSDGKEIFFCSNRNGGHGGLDMYTSTLDENGQWAEPVNLGSKINTPLDESAVFVTEDKSKLFFASEGHTSMGGNDLFVSQRNGLGEWGPAINLGSPVSTPDDDVFLSPGSSENNFYTYRFDIEKNDKNKIFQVVLGDNVLQPKVLLSGTLNFDQGLEPKAVDYLVTETNGAHPQILDKTDNQGNYAILVPPGNYNINYNYNTETTASQSLTINEEPVIDNIELEAPAWVVVEPETKKVRIILLKDILFDFDSAKLLAEYRGMLDTICAELKENDDLKLLVVGYCDSKGPANYNMLLSGRRSKAVASFFYDRGIASSRITVEGRGEKQPVAINSNPDGSDNVKGRSFNRRVTIELIDGAEDVRIKKLDIIPADLKVKQ